MAESAARQGVRKGIVFANGLQTAARNALEETCAVLLRDHGLSFAVVHSETNLGPATAYARLVKCAIQDRDAIDAVLMLDDDNILSDGCITALLRAWDGVGALSAVRSDRQYLVRAAKIGQMDVPALGEAYGFDLRKFSHRIRNRLGRRQGVADVQNLVFISRAPYGGLFVPRSLLEAVPPPRAEFVIYADDYDYTERLATAGGLHLVPNAVVDDQERSWNASPASTRRISNVVRLAMGEPDFRIYYALRNALVLDRARSRGRGAFWYKINLTGLRASLWANCILRNRPENLRVAWDAIRDAETNTLGLNQKYPLP